MKYPPLVPFTSVYPENKNLFIGLDGLDGVGKTTQAELLKQKLEKKGYKTHIVATRRSTDLGRYLCKAIFDEKYNLNCWDEIRIFHLINCYTVRHVVKPLLLRDKKTAIIYDRTQFTALAYQGIADGGGFEEVHDLHARSEYNMIPDLNFMVELPLGIAKQRREARKLDEDKYDRAPEEYREKVIQGYNLCKEHYPDIVNIDGTQEIQDVAMDIWSHVLGYIDEKSSN